jgi:hypothetical protein
VKSLAPEAEAMERSIPTDSEGDSIMPFQPAAGSNPFITLSSPTGVLLSSAGLPPTTVFAPGTPFTVSLTANLAGILAPALGATASFTFTANAESIGPGFEGVLGSTIVGPPGVSRTGTIPVAGLPVGTYMVTVAVTSTNGGVPTAMSGFESSMITVQVGA